jgi:hypothetical protein
MVCPGGGKEISVDALRADWTVKHSDRAMNALKRLNVGKA